MNITFLEQSKSLEDLKKDWIEQCYNKSKSYSSRDGAIQLLSNFQKFLIDKHPTLTEQQIIIDLKNLSIASESYIKLYQFLNSYVQWLNTKDASPRTIQKYLAFLKSWFRYNGIRIYKEDSKQFITMPKILKERKVPLRQEHIQILLDKAGNLYKALILFSSSSGMRISEILQLYIDDLDLSVTPVRIRVRAETTKLREERRTFISSEALEALRPIIQDKTIKQHVFWEDDNLKELLLKVESTFDKIRDRSGLVDKYSTGIHHVRIHSFRNYFISQAEKLHEGFGHALAGHGKYMKEYENYTDSELRDFYLKIEPNLRISI